MTFTIPARYCGPPHSGNGGWVSGAVAALVTPTAELPCASVRLSSPPPLDRALQVDRDADGTVRVSDGEVLVATGRPAPRPPSQDIPPAPTLDRARAAAAAYDTSASHAFPTCFVCGPERARGDGLRIFTGPVPGRDDMVAAPWVPTESDTETVWAALDCPGAWAMHFDRVPMVLGSMTLELYRLPEVGAEHVVVGWARGVEGRKHFCGTALFTADGELLAHADATWIGIQPETIRPVGFVAG